MKRTKKVLGLCLAVLYLFTMSLTTLAGDNPAFGEQYITDAAGILSDEQVEELENKAQKISEKYHCGVYAITVDSFYDYSDLDASDAAQNIYSDYGLGYGEEKDGFLLFLSMSDRDYSLIAYGDFGNASLTDYGKDDMSNSFLFYFGDDEWYEGFDDYLETSDKYLEMSQNGEPFDIDTDPVAKVVGFAMSYGLFGVIGIIVGFIVCGSMKRKMMSVKTAAEARTYVKDGKVNMQLREDRYTHTTQVRQKIEKQTKSSGGSSGGTTINSRGFSSKSGKF